MRILGELPPEPDAPQQGGGIRILGELPPEKPVDMGGFMGQAWADLKAAGGAALSSTATIGQGVTQGFRRLASYLSPNAPQFDNGAFAAAGPITAPASVAAAMDQRTQENRQGFGIPGVMAAEQPLQAAQHYGESMNLPPGTATNENRFQRGIREHVAPMAGALAPQILSGPLGLAAQTAETLRQEAERSGAGLDDQDIAFGMGGGVGAALGMVPGVGEVGSVKQRLLLHALSGSVQGGSQKLAENVVAKDVAGYDPSRDYSEGVVPATIGGGIAGGVIGGVHEAFGPSATPRPPTDDFAGITLPDDPLGVKSAEVARETTPAPELTPLERAVRGGYDQAETQARQAPFDQRVRGAVDEAFQGYDPQEGKFGAEPEPNPLGKVRPEMRRAVDREAELIRQPSPQEIDANLAENAFDQGAGRGYGIAEENPQGGYSPVTNSPQRRIDTDFSDLDARYDKNAGLPDRIPEPPKPWQPHEGPDSPRLDDLSQLERETMTRDNLGRMSHRENGKLKPSYQKTMDALNAERSGLKETKPKGKSGELYGGLPLPFKAAAAPVKLAGEAVRGAYRAAAEPMIDKVARQGGEAGRELADRARAVVQKEAELEGRFYPTIKKVEDAFAVGFKGSLTGANKAKAQLRKWLQSATLVPEVTLPDGSKYSFANSQAIAERDFPTLPPSVKKAQDLLREVATATGDAATSEGFLRPDGSVFKGKAGSKVLVRQIKPEGRHWLARGGGEEFDTIIDGIAHANGADREAIKKAFTDSGMINPSPEKHVGFLEDYRVLKNMPTDFVTPSGKKIHFMETDPVSYAESLARQTANAVAVQHGFHEDGKSTIPDLRQRFADARGDQRGELKDVTDMLETLQGRNTGSYAGVKGSSPEVGPAARGKFLGSATVRAATQAVKTGFSEGALSLSAVPNLAQTLVFGPETAGARHFVKGLAESVKNPRTSAESLRNIGAMHDGVEDYFNRSGRQIEDFIRNMGRRSPTHQAARMANTFNDVVMGNTARSLLAEMKADAGKGRMREANAESLRRLKFNDAQIDTLMKGNAPATLQNEVVRRAIDQTQFSGRNKAEKSKLQNDPRFRIPLQFQSYALGTIERVATHMGAMDKAIKSGDGARIRAAIGAGLLATAGVQASAELTEWLKGALTGREPDNEGQTPMERFGKNMLKSGLAGPLQGFLYADTKELKENPVATAAKMIPAVRAGSNVWDAVIGNKFYADLPPADRALKLLGSQVPITRIGRAFTVAQGLRDPKIDTQIRHYYDMFPVDAPDGKPEDAVFRRQVKAAVEAIRDSDEPKAIRLLRAAAQAKADTGKLGKVGVRDSLKRKMIYDNMKPAQRDQFRERYGDAALESLKTYDGLLKELRKAFAKETADEHFPRPAKAPATGGSIRESIQPGT